MPIAYSAAAWGWWGLHLQGQQEILSLLICSVWGVRQCLVTLVNELLCYLGEKVATYGTVASISIQGLQTFQKITKEQ